MGELSPGVPTMIVTTLFHVLLPFVAVNRKQQFTTKLSASEDKTIKVEGARIFTRTKFPTSASGLDCYGNCIYDLDTYPAKLLHAATDQGLVAQRISHS